MKLSNDVSAALAEDHHVVRYDVRGAGRSDAPARRGGDYRLAQRGRQSSDALRRAAARCGAGFSRSSPRWAGPDLGCGVFHHP
ncbi:hypothetical protein [Streptomyces sp. CA-106131]|uniref:hypothetical protein n=1 Tax=Streptomyces sp. CA-106131 TaxID=3240045 RepID=UPI003D8B527F